MGIVALLSSRTVSNTFSKSNGRAFLDFSGEARKTKSQITNLNHR